MLRLFGSIRCHPSRHPLFRTVWEQATFGKTLNFASWVSGGDRHFVARPRTVLNSHPAVDGRPMRPMRMQPHTAAAGHVITREDNLWVHRLTKARAYAIWVSSGCRCGTALRDWVQAENEVLVEFCAQQVRPFARGRASCERRKRFSARSASNRQAAAVYSQTERSLQLQERNVL
jgi:hypothetical protein